MRWIPPAHSPVVGGALFAGARALPFGSSRATHDRLRAIIAERFAGRAVLLTDSGTTALRLAIAAARRRRDGATVAVPAYSCYDVATAVVGADAPVLTYDLDAGTLGPDGASLRRAVAGGAGVVVVAHLHGMPVDLALVQAALSGTGALLVEDAAQGGGGEYGGRVLGSFGAVSVLSFGRGKGLTGGGGGALVGHDAEGEAILDWAATQLDAPIRGSRALALLWAQWALSRPRLYGIPASVPFLGLGETVYHEPWTPRRIAATSVAAVLHNWEASWAEVVTRRRHAGRLLGAGAGAGFDPVTVAERAVPGYLRLPLLASRDDLPTLPGARQLGIAPGYPTPLLQLPAFRRQCRNPDERCPGAAVLARRLVTLPTHGGLADRDLAVLENFLRRPGGSGPPRTG